MKHLQKKLRLIVIVVGSKGRIGVVCGVGLVGNARSCCAGLMGVEMSDEIKEIIFDEPGVLRCPYCNSWDKAWADAKPDIYQCEVCGRDCRLREQPTKLVGFSRLLV